VISSATRYIHDNDEIYFGLVVVQMYPKTFILIKIKKHC